MAKATYINDGDFAKEVLESSIPVVLDFTAVWCQPCKAIAPLLDQVAGEKEGQVKVLKMDIDQNPETPNQYGVMSIPTLLFFKGGKVVEKQVGALRKPQLDTMVARLLG
jgi:thioredoxin 1